jgi:hypothetical protein
MDSAVMRMIGKTRTRMIEALMISNNLLKKYFKASIRKRGGAYNVIPAIS